MIVIETTVYVSVANNSYSYVPLGTPCEFELKMNSEKARIFERLFLQIDSLEFHNAVRAHLPYLPYHLDESNHEIDSRIAKIYALIHEFGDDDTKEFVEKLPYFN
ncbi:transposase [Ureibacillus massiliensis 4400831 = CIP 108448 = CCUG 49529]|uniref:Transposase n=1 Tax=Ureibacillus massiliensis 4400831 = CIP 108448 = CCUG 49529 TaxID=1211035 RepID=A0A0A3JP92_9BACL|nr:transposase [Ureibacillus massiliensis 4400831 = CIP 108448 = CCUG 49529]